MINAITGKLVEVNPNSLSVLTPGGVEYYIEVSANSASKFSTLPSDKKEDVRVLTVLQHREDAMTLFGFFDDKERFCFNQLQTVPGIGAKGALKILSGITVEKLVTYLDASDVKSLSKVPGLGAKTAQKLILQLRNVLVLEERAEEEKAASKIERFTDMVSSFVEMGYDRKQVRRAIDEALNENALLFSGMDDRKIEEKLLPLVLRRLG